MNPQCGVFHEEFGKADHSPLVGICGHSVCKTCAQTLRGQMNQACPICQHARAFHNASRNYQMIDVLDAMATLELEKQSFETENTNIQKVFDEHGFNKKIFVTCPVCSERVGENKLRICLDCNKKNETIQVDPDNIVTVNDFEKFESEAMCPSCFLDSDHKPHENALFLPIKIRNSAKKEFGTLRDTVKLKYMPRFTSDLNRIMAEGSRLQEPLKVLQSDAESASNSSELHRIVTKGREMETKLDRIMLECHKGMKKCAEQIVEVASSVDGVTERSCLEEVDSLSSPPHNYKVSRFGRKVKHGRVTLERQPRGNRPNGVLDAFFVDNSLADRTVSIDIWNSDPDLPCEFEIGDLPAYCRVTPHAGEIPPAGRAQLRIVHEADCPSDTFSLRIQYHVGTDPAKSSTWEIFDLRYSFTPESEKTVNK